MAKEGLEEGQKGRQEDEDHQESREDCKEAGKEKGCKKASQAGSRQKAREKGGASVCSEDPRGGAQSRPEGRSARRCAVNVGRCPDVEPRPRRRRGVGLPYGWLVQTQPSLACGRSRRLQGTGASLHRGGARRLLCALLRSLILPGKA